VSDIRSHETSDLQGFLHAEVGSGASRERVTVSLAFSHLGFDPESEAKRLSALRRTSAVKNLSEVIVATPGSTWDFNAAAVISDHLVRLLPVHLPRGAA
jgi:hypothetical protein